MADDFETHQPGLTTPAQAAVAIVPSDVQPLAHVTRGIYVGGAGNLRVVMLSGETVTLVGVVAGTIYPIRVAQVRSTGTTATGLLGLR